MTLIDTPQSLHIVRGGSTDPFLVGLDNGETFTLRCGQTLVSLLGDAAVVPVTVGDGWLP